MGERNTKDEDEVPELQLKIYERIPIPDLPVNTFSLLIFWLNPVFICYAMHITLHICKS